MIHIITDHESLEAEDGTVQINAAGVLSIYTIGGGPATHYAPGTWRRVTEDGPVPWQAAELGAV